MKTLRIVVAGLLILACPALVQAATIPMITDGTDLSFWNEKVDDGDDVNDYGIENVPAPTPFASGDAMRMWDLYDGDKPELQGETAGALTTPFRVDFQSQYTEPPFPILPSSAALRFRVANSGDSITSESRSAFSVSWQADGEVTAKYEGGGGSVSTLNSDPLSGPQDVSLIINPAVGSSFSYNYFGLTRTLNPTSYDVYINGVLLNDDADPEFANGLEFTLTKSAGDFDPALGIQRFGIVGSSNADVGPDYLLDNVILTTDIPPIPEPTSGLLLMLGAIGMAAFGRRRI